MNRIYRLVWSHVTNGWVPVSELARGRGKRASRRLAATTLALTAAAAQAGPSGGQVVAGGGVITQSGSTTTVAQSSQNLSVNWVSFNIAPQETVNFLQPSASSIAINRIFDPNGTQILGHLNANGQVYLINPNGVLFGAGAQVNVGGLVASTLDVNDATLADSQRTFKGDGSGSVINQGTITAANGGYVALLGNHVSNQGTISAQLGTVALGAGSAVTLTYSKNNLVQVQVDQSVLNNEAENGGLVAADGGKVIMTAGARNALLASAVNNTGVIEARTVENQEGSVTLLGGMAAGTVNVGGTIDASAPNGGNGGQIETSAANVNIAPNAKVTTAAAQGLYGSWLIDPSDFTVASSGGNETGGALSSALGSGNVTLQSSSGSAGGSGNVNINDTVSWSANTTLTLTASNNVNVNASVTASGATAGIAINPNTANGSETPSGSGIFSLGNGGVINLPNVSASSTAALRIGGASYTVINSLGAAGSVTGTDLQGMRGALAKNYALGSNINASATSGWNSGAGFTPIGVASGTPSSATDFTGIFDGLGHTITGLTINNSSVNGGLFAAVSGTVRNVGMVGGSISAGGYSGGLVGELNYGTVSNSYATGNVSAPNVQGLGGLVGWMNDGTVKNSYATGNVTASSVSGSLSNGIGGLVGGMQGGLVTNSHATGAVSGGESVGGLVGYMYAGPVPGGSTPRTATVSNSYATGAVTGNFSVGGLVGCSYGFGAAATVSNSYATGNVTGVTSPAGAPSAFLGGLMGHNYGGYGSNVATVSNSYATGNVTGYQYVGGLIGGNAGFASGGIVNDSYSTGQVSLSSGGSGSGGLIGDNSNYNVGDPGIAGTISNSYWNLTTSAQGTSAGGSGLTSGQMLVQSSFNSWNFSANGTWVKYSGTDPLLIADMTAATVTATAASRTYDGTAYSGGNGVTVTETINGLTSTVTASLTGLTYAGTSQGAVNAGSYVITPSGLSSNQQGYYFTYGSGTLTVNPRALNGSITAGSSVYGSALTPGTVSFTNAVAGNVPTATVSVDTTGHTSTSSHLNAGSYTGIETVTALSGGTDSGDYTIGTITGNYTVTPLALTGSIAAGSSTYGSALSPGAASLSGAVAGDILGTATVSVNTTGNTSTGSHLNAGSYTGIESVTGLSGADGGNYTFAGVTGNYTVGKLALTGSIAAGSSVYGSALAPGALSFTNAAAGDVVTGGSVSVNTTGNTSTSGNLKAGSYTGIESAGSTLGGADAANYTFAGATGDYTVSKLALTGSITAGSSVYGSALAPGAATFTNVIAGDVVTGGSVSVDTSGNTSTSGHLNAGSYTGIESVSGLTGADSGNYSLTALNGNYTVSKLALTASIATGNSVYGAALAPGAVTFTNAIGSDLVAAGTVSVNTSGNTSTSGHLNAGSYTGIESAGSTLGGADAANYTFAGATGDYTVSKLALTGSIAAGNSVYGSALAPGALTFTNAVAGDVVTGGSVSVNTTGNTSTSGHLNAGSYTGIESAGSTLGGADAANYTFAGATGDYTVSPLALTASIATGNSVYGAALAPGAVTFTNAIGSDVVAAGTVAVNTSGNTSTSGNLKAGSYTGIESVGSTLNGADAGNYTFAGAAGDYTVSKLALTGSLAAGNSVYGSALAPGALTFTNAVAGDVVTGGSVSVNTVGNTSTSGHLNAGSYTGIESAGSTLGGADAANYTFAGATGDYTVSKLALTGSIAAGSSVYGAALAPGAATFTNAISGDVVTGGSVSVDTTGNTSTSGNLKAGSYTGIESVGSTLSGSDAGNYTFAGATGDYTVSKLALTGSLAAGSSVYGSALAPGALTFTNAVAGDVVTGGSVSVNTAGNTSTSGHLNAGSYTGIESAGSTLGGADAANYTFAGATGDYTVSKLALTGSLAAGSSVYGSALAPGALTFTNAVAGDVVTGGSVSVNTAGNTSTSGHLNAGSYTGIESAGSTLGGADAANYTFAGATGDYTVSPLALTASIATGNSVYGAALAPGAVTFTNAIGSDVIAAGTVAVNTSGNTSTSGNLKAGSYTAIESVGSTLSGADAGNYTFAGATGDYTVSKLALTGSLAAGSSVYGSALAPGALSFTNAVAGDVVTGGSVSVNTVGNTSTSGNLKAGSYTGIESAGSTLGGADAANYTFAGATGDYTVSKLALSGSIGVGSSVYGAALAPGAATFTNVVSGDVVTGGSVSVNTTGNTSTSGNLKAGSYTGIESMSVLAGADSGNYSFAGLTGNYTVSPLALTASIATGNSVYGTALAPGAVTFTNAIGSDVVAAGTVAVNTSGNTSTSGNLKAGSYTAIESVGSTLSGADAGNYTFAGATGDYTVGKLALTGSIVAGSSVYGSALAPGALTFTNSVAGDVVTGGSVSVNTAGNTSTSGNLKAGSYTGIESAGSTLGGADAANYTFAGATGDYTVSKLTLSGSIAAGSSVYGAALAPGAVTLTNVIAGDVVTGGSVSVDTTGNTSTSGNLKAGSYTGIESVTALTGADSGSYSLTALTGNYTVSKLALTGSIGAGTSVYGAVLAPGAATFTNVISGDVVSGSVSVNTTGITSTSGNLRAGSYTGIEAVTGLTGADGGNYTVASAVGNYTVTPLTIAVTAIGANKVYDGTVADSPTLSSAGLISGDLVSFSDTSATFVDKNVGTGKAVSVSGITASGADVGNYVIGNTTATTTADITPLTITVAATANSKVYDGSTTAAVALSGGLAGDSLTFSDTAANFSNPNAGTSKVVTVSGISVGGADAADYTLSSTSASTTGSITPATLTVSAETANNKVYDGTVAATLSGGNLVGVIAGDSVSLNGAGSFTSKDVGTGIAVTPTDTLSGTSASNYVLSQPTGLSASITPATLTYIATPTTLIAGLTPSGLGGSVSGFVASDTLANATTGALAWNTPAASGSPAGHYAIDGGGLSATNYVFVQDADNATALTLVPGTPPQSVINELATLDGNFTSSAPVATRLDDNQHSFSLQVIDGGVRLPDDRSNAN